MYKSKYVCFIDIPSFGTTESIRWFISDIIVNNQYAEIVDKTNCRKRIGIRNHFPISYKPFPTKCVTVITFSVHSMAKMMPLVRAGKGYFRLCN